MARKTHLLTLRRQWFVSKRTRIRISLTSFLLLAIILLSIIFHRGHSLESSKFSLICLALLLNYLFWGRNLFLIAYYFTLITHGRQLIIFFSLFLFGLNRCSVCWFAYVLWFLVCFITFSLTDLDVTFLPSIPYYVSQNCRFFFFKKDRMANLSSPKN